MRGEEPQGDGEAGGCCQGAGRCRGQLCIRELSLIYKYFQGGVELPANWQPGDQALPDNLEDKWDFLGLNILQSEKERGGHMGDTKVEQY